MKSSLFGITLCLGLSACGGGGGGNENTSALNAGRFFDESWIEPRNGWWLRTPQRLWPFATDNWADYIMARFKAKETFEGAFSVGESYACDISGSMSILDAEYTNQNNYYYRTHFQDCVMDARQEESAKEPVFIESREKIEFTVNGIISQRYQSLPTAEGVQYKSANGFEEVHLTIPSLSPEKSSDTYLVTTPSPLEYTITDLANERSRSQRIGTMMITRGDESITFSFQNHSSERDTSYRDCGPEVYSSEDISINSSQFGLLRYNFSEQVPAGESSSDNCFRPGFEYKRGNTPITQSPDRMAYRFDLIRAPEDTSTLSDSDSLFNFTHADGSRMRITSTANPPETTVEVDKDGDGSFEISKTFSDEEYLSSMQLLRDVKRKTKEEE